ncbi:MAG: DegT/DnrJ/EryC1/StrS aminotransferase family protein [Candidatus Omnitrophota bacterium]
MFRVIPRFRVSLEWREIWCGLFADKPRDFEEAFSAYIGVRNAIAVPSGRAGLYVILKSLGIGENADIILPAFTYWAIPATIKMLGFNPVFVDIDPDTYEMRPEILKGKITGKAGAVIPTHLYGLPCDISAIAEIAGQRGLTVIEDCVQSCGAVHHGRKAGSFGKAAYFSFGITKNIPLIGGGMVVTDDDALAAKIRSAIAGCGLLGQSAVVRKLCQAALMKTFTVPAVFMCGLYPFVLISSVLGRDIVHNVFAENKSPVPENDFKKHLKLLPPQILSRMGGAVLSRLDGMISARVRHGRALRGLLADARDVTLPRDPGDNIFTNFPVRHNERECFRKELLKRGVDTSAGYMEAFGDAPNAKKAAREILHLPLYPSLSEDDILYMGNAVKSAVARTGL